MPRQTGRTRRAATNPQNHAQLQDALDDTLSTIRLATTGNTCQRQSGLEQADSLDRPARLQEGSTVVLSSSPSLPSSPVDTSIVASSDTLSMSGIGFLLIKSSGHNLKITFMRMNMSLVEVRLRLFS
ncbi:MAG: hypothetical protein M1840_005360 [Geoglossum simile]|nr:MAG: hypothetical protein M1840_005360 [Geoglossum simile]